MKKNYCTPKMHTLWVGSEQTLCLSNGVNGAGQLRSETVDDYWK